MDLIEEEHTLTNQLQQLAENARSHAYVPYSTFQVGASLETEDGTLYSGVTLKMRLMD